MTRTQYLKAWKHINEHGLTEKVKGAKYNDVAQMVQDGCFDCYYDSARRTLQDIYNETDEQAAKYTDEQVWNQYKHIIALTSQHPKYAVI